MADIVAFTDGDTAPEVRDKLNELVTKINYLWSNMQVQFAGQGRRILTGVAGDGYIYLPCNDVESATNFEADFAVAHLIATGLTANIGGGGVATPPAYTSTPAGEGEPMDSFVSLWANAIVEIGGVWYVEIQYRNVTLAENLGFSWWAVKYT